MRPRTIEDTSSMQLPTPKKDLPLPVWERGHRGHGYWLRETNTRVGYVGLTPRCHRPVEYHWYLDGDATKPPNEGTAKTLRSAKRAVERAFRANYSWRFPASRGY